jgi:hypothetical protein
MFLKDWLVNKKTISEMKLKVGLECSIMLLLRKQLSEFLLLLKRSLEWEIKINLGKNLLRIKTNKIMKSK